MNDPSNLTHRSSEPIAGGKETPDLFQRVRGGDPLAVAHARRHLAGHKADVLAAAERLNALSVDEMIADPLQAKFQALKVRKLAEDIERLVEALAPMSGDPA